jgi:hypothetical protein
MGQVPRGSEGIRAPENVVDAFPARSGRRFQRPTISLRGTRSRDAGCEHRSATGVGDGVAFRQRVSAGSIQAAGLAGERKDIPPYGGRCDDRGLPHFRGIRRARGGGASLVRPSGASSERATKVLRTGGRAPLRIRRPPEALGAGGVGRQGPQAPGAEASRSTTNQVIPNRMVDTPERGGRGTASSHARSICEPAWVRTALAWFDPRSRGRGDQRDSRPGFRAMTTSIALRWGTPPELEMNSSWAESKICQSP